jgi:hypothetical protein
MDDKGIKKFRRHFIKIFVYYDDDDNENYVMEPEIER